MENKKSVLLKRRRNMLILLGVLCLGIGYNIYKVFFKSDTTQKIENLSLDNIKNLPEELKGKLQEQFNSIDKNTLKEISESNIDFQKFLDSADVILNDSMDCDCPDVKRRMKEKARIEDSIKEVNNTFGKSGL